ncbi:hypothetical protein [Caulobacter sp. UNC279MFTsu5.1]|uniref:hypothetical protein n=1 Tax=Caulobacter sp. UNC279MFTsu5.1 TaxID=1502775 RepID=UPI00036E7FAF|nr:hypothetical protein [Caulobacter sp. UNC279MFTsu5.1]
MWKRMRGWFGGKPAPEVETVKTYALHDLYPVLIPKAFAATGSWIGPVEALEVDGLDLSWGVRGAANWLDYLNHDMVASWEGQGADWRAAATANLARMAATRPWSGELRDDDGRMILVVFLHDDGLGPSRLMIPGLLDDVFPDGYEVAIPELTCAVAVGRVAGEEDPRAEQMVQGCFEHGTHPVSPRRYAPEVFWGL